MKNESRDSQDRKSQDQKTPAAKFDGPWTAPIGEAMTEDVLAVPENLSLESLRAVFIKNAIGGAPVVDAEGALVGVVCQTDLVREQIEDDWGTRLSSSPPPGLTDPLSSDELTALDGNDDLDGMDGLDGTGSGLDLGPEELDGFQLLRPEARTVSDIMSRDPVAVSESFSVGRVARVMIKRGLRRLVVVNGEGHVRGVVTAMDLVRWTTPPLAQVSPTQSTEPGELTTGT